MSEPPTNGAVTITLDVQWGEMDALGHVNNTRYFAWFESARIALFERIGVVTRGPSSVGPILATTTCDFLSPVVFPARLVVAARVTKVGETSLVMAYDVTCAATGKAYARGSSVAVLIDHTTHAKVRVPDAVRAAIAALGGA
jgi:acyl-CoA thioester hydrolase